MVPDQIVDHVITLIGLRKIFFCVIDNAIGADRFHKIDITRAADSSHVCAERLRDLDGESANAARRAVGTFRSEEHTSELQSHSDLVCRLLLEKKKKK